MSRRWLTVLLALGLLLSLASGCGARQTAVDTRTDGVFGTVPSAEPEESKIEEPAEVLEPESFSMPYSSERGWNPFTCMGMENRAVMQLIYEGLFTMTPDFEAEPWLCESFSVSEDGKNYTLELRQAVFSNGAALTAYDVVYSMDKAAESALYASRFRDIASYYAAGDNTVTVELHSANDRLPCLLTFPIVPNDSGDSAPGTGPFARTDNMLVQNGLWWQGTENLGIESVALYASASARDTRDNFEINNVHMVYNDPSASSAATFHCECETWNSRSTVMQYLGFNFSEGVFRDAEVRAAVTHAVDRVGIAESVYRNFADTAALPIHPASRTYQDTLINLAEDYSFTTSEAAMDELLGTESFYLPEQRIQELRGAEENEDGELQTADSALEQAEEPKPDPDTVPEEEEEKKTEYNSIVMVVRSGNLSRVQAAQQVAENLEAVGFTVEFRELDNDDFYDALASGMFDIYYGEATLKPDFDLRELLQPGGGMCYGGLWEDSQLNRLISNAMENHGNCYDLYQYIMDEGYLCPVLFVNNALFTTRGVFSGLNPAPDNLFYQISEIRVRH